MNKLLRSISALLVFICLVSVARADTGNDRVQAEMLANVAAIQPGKAFWAGFKFTIEPGYHIYWKNPGDSGLATEVKLKLPDGFTAGELMFPVPQRLALPGDVINYAYENQVMLLVQIMPPKDLPVGKPVTLSAKTDWLVCKDDCTPGRANVTIDLPVAQTTSPANEELFKTWGSQLPLKKDSADIASFSSSITLNNGGGSGKINIAWKAVPSDIQFIPDVMKDGEIENIKVATEGNKTTATFDAKDFKEHEAVPGLLTFTTAAGIKTGLEISIPGMLADGDVR